MGWSTKITVHKLRDEESRFLKVWCNKQGYDSDYIPLSLEGVLEEYSPYKPNLWCSEQLPILDQNRFLMLNQDLQVSVISAPLVENSTCKLQLENDFNRTYRSKAGQDKFLVYLEEYRGVSRKWYLKSQRRPKIPSMNIHYFQVKLGKKIIPLVSSISYKDENLESKMGQFDSQLATSYSFMI
jgi:hypothetical protein